MLWIYRDRLVDLKKDPRLVYGMIFKNVGAAAGASLEHTHSQLIVTPIVPISVAEEIDRVAAVLPLSRALRVLRHDRAGAGHSRQRIVLRYAGFRGLLPVRRPVSLRDLDRADRARQPLREHVAARRARNWPA